MNIKNLIIVILYTFSMFGCVTPKQHIIQNSPNKMYLLAYKQLTSNKYKSAIKTLIKLKKLYPFSSYQKKIELDLIYAHYKNADFIKSQFLIKKYIKFYPNDKNIDFCIYTNGLIEQKYFKISLLERFFKIDIYNRDVFHLKEAEKNFSKLLTSYPNSKYSSNAKINIKKLREQLASHELSIANFYYNHHNYLIVINRTKDIIKNYPNTNSAKKAIFIMNKAYKKYIH